MLSVSGVEAGGIGSSIFVGPEGHGLQIAGQRQTVLTEVNRKLRRNRPKKRKGKTLEVLSFFRARQFRIEISQNFDQTLEQRVSGLFIPGIDQARP